ncbi:MAG TPA: serine/threonine-protein kinase [Anaerolineales bacterium]|nr:serine/threonine-protein kinase [Anaerolineales bacterium]HLO30834.1 serine/threonine-protein kinase [Anaerolineales bacterium]
MDIYLPGTRIGQYEIASLPMMGGMGMVYFALDYGNEGRPVALKTFRPELLPDRAARDRFLREGTAWVELGSHPHIVRCYEVKYIDPTAFLVLELIAKEQNMPDASLRSWLIPGRPLPLEQALLFALQIARGMQSATEKIPGLVHRDLKPENVLVGADRLPGTNINRLRVTDFGLVKIIADGDMPAKAVAVEEIKPNHIQFTGGAGTLLYMAPEQWMGEALGVYTDIYALGCILLEMLTGRHPVDGHNLSDLQAAHCIGKLCPIPENLPDDAQAVLVRCLLFASEKRYRAWMEVVAAVEEVYYAVSGQLGVDVEEE